MKDLLEQTNRMWAFVFGVLEEPKKPMVEECLDHDYEVIHSQKKGEALYKVTRACMVCGDVKTVIEEGDDPRI